MSEKIKKSLANEMQNLDAAGLLRIETAAVAGDNMQTCFSNDKCALDFMGNDFLGWRNNIAVRKAAKDALAKHGTGSTSSRTSLGTLKLHQSLEQQLAAFLGFDDCMVFSSHYLAKIGLLEPLTGDRDSIFIDEMSNPGFFDGARLSSASVLPFRHNDMDDLEYHLKCSHNSRYRIIATDGVFYSNGQCARLEKIEQLQETYDAITVLDDSLGIGILGNGKGTLNHLSVGKYTELLTGSFEYALGNTGGGFIAGDKELITWLRLTSRAYLLSEPLSPVNAAMVIKVIELLQQDQSSVERLFSTKQYATHQMIKKAWQPTLNDAPFISINVGSTLNAQKMVEHLFENNVLVSGLCYPNTPEGASLLRFNISADHTEQHIDQLIVAVEQAFKYLA